MERESEADSALSTESHTGLHLITLASRPELKPRAQHLTHCITQASLISVTFKKLSLPF